MQHHATPDHALHDLALIAGHAAGDLSDAHAPAAITLLTVCSACAELHRDLVAIAAATRALPREARAPRDYTLTADQAASLRRGSWLRSLLRPFGSARSAMRPMAAAFSSVGVAGLLVAAFMPGMLGAGAAGPAREEFQAANAPGSGPVVDTVSPLVNAPAPRASDGDVFAGATDGTAAAGGKAGGETTTPDERVGTDDTANVSSAPSLLLVGSLGFLLVGLAMFGLRFAARRVR